MLRWGPGLEFDDAARGVARHREWARTRMDQECWKQVCGSGKLERVRVCIQAIRGCDAESNEGQNRIPSSMSPWGGHREYSPMVTEKGQCKTVRTLSLEFLDEKKWFFINITSIVYTILDGV